MLIIEFSYCQYMPDLINFKKWGLKGRVGDSGLQHMKTEKLILPLLEFTWQLHFLVHRVSCRCGTVGTFIPLDYVMLYIVMYHDLPKVELRDRKGNVSSEKLQPVSNLWEPYF